MPETPEGTDLKNIGTIDNVIDLNNLAKFGFGEIFRAEVHIRNIAL